MTGCIFDFVFFFSSTVVKKLLLIRMLVPGERKSSKNAFAHLGPLSALKVLMGGGSGINIYKMFE